MMFQGGNFATFGGNIQPAAGLVAPLPHMNLNMMTRFNPYYRAPALPQAQREKLIRTVYKEYLDPIFTPDGDTLLAVECGENRGVLYLSRFCQGSKGPCIRFENQWWTPNEFQYVSGRESAKDWKRSIRHQGKSLKLLIAKGILAVHPSSCSCTGCRISSPVNRGKLANFSTRYDGMERSSASPSPTSLSGEPITHHQKLQAWKSPSSPNGCSSESVDDRKESAMSPAMPVFGSPLGFSTHHTTEPQQRPVIDSNAGLRTIYPFPAPQCIPAQIPIGANHTNDPTEYFNLQQKLYFHQLQQQHMLRLQHGTLNYGEFQQRTGLFPQAHQVQLLTTSAMNPGARPSVPTFDPYVSDNSDSSSPPKCSDRICTPVGSPGALDLSVHSDEKKVPVARSSKPANPPPRVPSRGLFGHSSNASKSPSNETQQSAIKFSVRHLLYSPVSSNACFENSSDVSVEDSSCRKRRRMDWDASSRRDSSEERETQETSFFEDNEFAEDEERPISV